MFTQTDLSLTHKYKFGRDDRFAAAFDLNVTNVFNEANVLDVYNTIDSGDASLRCGDIDASFTATQCMNYILTNGVTSNVATFMQDPLNQDARYRLPSTFQAPRSVRFGFRLIF
jgi:hypothetical protein